MRVLANIRIVLSRPTHPGNIGAAARAMKTMGLTRLALVAPKRFPAPEAAALAADAGDVLDRATVLSSLAEAVQDCRLVVGCSARPRRIGWPTMTPAEGARRLAEAAATGTVALVFGQERTGLTNDELDRCHAVITIPANPEYPSLNLASAVQVLAYELRQTALAGASETGEGEAAGSPVTQDQLDLLYRHLEEVLVEIRFLDPNNPRLLMRRLKRLFNRAGLDQNELNILRGILTEVERSLRKS
ncbi:MAG: RNA methyltransferase [Gammaproteobacteria bacterium]|nr:MAG: RNA methyltransferase [Gammaproteobacteria bacterium]